NECACLDRPCPATPVAARPVGPHRAIQAPDIHAVALQFQKGIPSTVGGLTAVHCAWCLRAKTCRETSGRPGQGYSLGPLQGECDLRLGGRQRESYARDVLRSSPSQLGESAVRRYTTLQLAGVLCALLWLPPSTAHAAPSTRHVVN